MRDQKTQDLGADPVFVHHMYVLCAGTDPDSDPYVKMNAGTICFQKFKYNTFQFLHRPFMRFLLNLVWPSFHVMCKGEKRKTIARVTWKREMI